MICPAGETNPNLCQSDDANTSGAGDADRLVGGSGDDELRAGGGTDWLDGGSGADILMGGVEAAAPFPDQLERLYGGEGADHLYSGNAGIQRSELGVHRALLDGGDGPDELVGAYHTLDLMYGGDGADRLDAGGAAFFADRACRLRDAADDAIGSQCQDRLSGGLGDDVLIGSPAAELLRGGSDDDELFGGRGGDSLNGGEGDDLIYAGEGRDELTGGSGDDVLNGYDVDASSSSFVVFDTFRCGSGYDTVIRRRNDATPPPDCELVLTH